MVSSSRAECQPVFNKSLKTYLEQTDIFAGDWGWRREWGRRAALESRRWGMVRAGAEDPRGLSLFPFTSPASLASEKPNGCSAPGPPPQQDTHSRGSAQPAGQGLPSRGFCSPDKHHAPGCRTHGFTAAVPGASQRNAQATDDLDRPCPVQLGRDAGKSRPSKG